LREEWEEQWKEGDVITVADKGEEMGTAEKENERER
jgi:hypothetical protein